MKPYRMNVKEKVEKDVEVVITDSKVIDVLKRVVRDHYKEIYSNSGWKLDDVKLIEISIEANIKETNSNGIKSERLYIVRSVVSEE